MSACDPPILPPETVRDIIFMLTILYIDDLVVGPLSLLAEQDIVALAQVRSQDERGQTALTFAPVYGAQSELQPGGGSPCVICAASAVYFGGSLCPCSKHY